MRQLKNIMEISFQLISPMANFATSPSSTRRSPRSSTARLAELPLLLGMLEAGLESEKAHTSIFGSFTAAVEDFPSWLFVQVCW